MTIIGAARSGIAAAKLMQRNGARVLVSDYGSISSERKDILKENQIPFEEGGHSRKALDADFIIVSPGVPSDVPFLRSASKAGISIYSEIEAASWFFPGKIHAITGSNGKTTTTSMVSHLLERCGIEHFMAGNIGYPFSDFADNSSPDTIAVLEVSSFQLDHIESFRPAVSSLLNITPDHLDRYQNNFRNYADSKARIFENMGASDALIYNIDDQVVRQLVHERAKGIRLFQLSLKGIDAPGGYEEDGYLNFSIGEEIFKLDVNSVPLRGRHNLYNTLAAVLAALLLEARFDEIKKALNSFTGVVHRLEHIRTVEGVKYINDSKATNVEAVWYALDSFERPVLLIAGGRDKGNDYSSLIPLVKKTGTCYTGNRRKRRQSDRNNSEIMPRFQ